MVPLGDAVKDGISVSFHSDMPMAPTKPLQLVWAGVNRTTFEGPVADPRHRVSVDLALKAITLDAAYSIRMEAKVGSIEVGKDTNLTVLEQSPDDVPPDRLKEIRDWGTMLEGRVQPVPGGLKMSGTKPAKAAASAQGTQDACGHAGRHGARGEPDESYARSLTAS